MLFKEHYIVYLVQQNMLACSNVKKQNIIFQIVYIIVGPLCPTSLKCFVFHKIPPSDNMLWLANWHRVVSAMPFIIIVSFSFQNKCKDS